MFNRKPIRDPSVIQAGDIIGFTGDNWVSWGINLATYGIPWWSISHVGIMGEHDGRLLLFESTTLDDEPCEIAGKVFSGSQAHDLGTRLKGYRGKVWHYPLYRPLFDHERTRLTDFLHATLGLPYDTIGAFRSGGHAFNWIESHLQNEDLHSLFCSEWCAAAHADIGLFQTDSGSRWNPNKFTRAERRLGILKKPMRLK